MLRQSPISILFVAERVAEALQSFTTYLKGIGQIRLQVRSRIPEDLGAYDVAVTDSDAVAASPDASRRLDRFAQSGGGWLMLASLSEKPLPDLFGVGCGPVGPEAELRVLFDDPHHPLAERLPEAVYLPGRYHPLEVTDEGAETILYADWHYRHSPVLVQRPAGDGLTACTTLQAYDHPFLKQVLFRLLRRLSGQPHTDQTLGVGLLGYAPSVGQLHGMGIEATAGLALKGVCDLNPARLEQARQDFPGVAAVSDSKALAADPEVDLVIVATAPNIHASLAVDMMRAGKHVVCEKPLALNRSETDAMIETAEKQGVHLSCHQNRRWDVDYLAIRQAVSEGQIGDLFYLETFVGGFSHPCGYWHSHAPVSGGTSYDWGGHYLDWIVSLIPERVTAVLGTRHKRVWHDVTNADQERILIRFEGGREAEFLHSDIAAVRKPKWYLLGTSGAIVGQWQDVTTYAIDPVLYFHPHTIPATEMPPSLSLLSRRSTGQMITQQLPAPVREDFAFHKNLADHLLLGEPIVAPLEDSVKVVAILEAAAISAARGGTLEVLNV
jgi:predicted dehydrogenase